MQIRYCLYFNIILSNLQQELYENREFQWAKIMFVAQVISVLSHMFLKMDCVPILKYLSKYLFIFKIKLLGG